MKKILILSVFLLSVMLYGKDLILLKQGNVSIQLVGDRESCTIEMYLSGKVMDSNCAKMTNSKKLKIFCTPEKTMCKTLDEVKDFMHEDKIENLYQDMPYYQARKAILKMHYMPIEADSLHYGLAKIAYNRGYIEVDDCADSSTLNPCVFKFTANNGKILHVYTYTKEAQHNGIFVTSWSFE
ncbi:hypothetical protein MNB_SV-13-1929 [hydrothermal vent metagenome]|uniref:Uncharacterized protein n=1 Tax=hydrothermal vent metagenome TaxID=652676 RepID=A0A1W1BFZ9_9ZZZZ